MLNKKANNKWKRLYQEAKKKAYVRLRVMEL